MKYEELNYISKNNMNEMIANGNPDDLCYGLLSISNLHEDIDWAYSIIKKLLTNENSTVQKYALKGLGAIVRRNAYIKLTDALSEIVENGINIIHHSEYADLLDDINMFQEHPK